MDYLIISIGQAGNQINYELTKLFVNNDKHLYTTINGDLLKNILIDSEMKVVEKYLKDDELKKYYFNGVNVVRNSSGRGNNWALGFNEKFKENRCEKNISEESFELIEKYIEKCDFLKGIVFIHSLNGGTGSGVTSRLIQNVRNAYPKFTIIDCPVIGLNSRFI